MSLGKLSGESQSFPNVRLFKIRKIFQQLLDTAARCHRLDDHPHRYAHAPDTWFSSHDLRV